MKTASPPINAKPSKRRWLLLGPMLGLAAWLAVFGDKTPSNGTAAVSLPARSTNSPINPLAPKQADVPMMDAPKELSALRSRSPLRPQPPGQSRVRPGMRDLFSGKNWNPPPPPPPPVAVVTPMAPPLPFAFLGKKVEDGIWEVFLSRGEVTFIVREGMTFETSYRVDKITPNTLSLTYLPLNQAQTLAIGDER